MQTKIKLLSKFEKVNAGECITVDDALAARLSAEGTAEHVSFVDPPAVDDSTAHLCTRRESLMLELRAAETGYHEACVSVRKLEQLKADCLVDGDEIMADWQQQMDAAVAEKSRYADDIRDLQNALAALRDRLDGAVSEATKTLARTLRKQQADAMRRMCEVLENACRINAELRQIFTQACASIPSKTWMHHQAEVANWSIGTLHADLARFQAGLRRLETRIAMDEA